MMGLDFLDGEITVVMGTLVSMERVEKCEENK